MYCIYCGSQNPDDANFCSNCGKGTVSNQSEEAVESVEEDEPQSKVQAHHPWMSAQQPQERQRVQQQSHEQSRQQIQEEPEPQIQEGTLSRLKSILARINGWSMKKKILWGIVAGFLLLVCAAAIAGEPVEETNSGSSSESTTSEKEQEIDNKLVKEFGCQWIMDTYRPMVELGREMAVLNLSTEMTLKRDELSYIGSGDAAEALRTCEAAGHR